ncbi:MAG: hypothetical protein ACOYBW_09295 [Fluviibacter phosphoraccumulans]
MTTVSGYHVVKTPCCGAIYSKTAYGSINFAGWQRWSDGEESGVLYSNDESVCHCECGQYFLTKDADQLEYIRYRSWKQIVEKTENEPVQPKILPYLTQRDAFELVSQGTKLPSGEIEAFIRLLVWQALNDRDRVAKSDDLSEFDLGFISRLRGNFVKKNEPWKSLPDDEAILMHRANLVELTPLLEAWFPKSHFLIGNAYRALGEHEKAIDRFEKVNNEPESIVNYLIKKAEAGYEKVVRIDPPEWLDELVMPEPWINTKPGKNPIALSSKRFWFKIFGMLNQLWALIEPRTDSEEVTVYWIDDNASIVKSGEFISEQAAWIALEDSGFILFEDERDVWEIMCPPGGPYKLKPVDQG